MLAIGAQGPATGEARVANTKKTVTSIRSQHNSTGAQSGGLSLPPGNQASAGTETIPCSRTNTTSTWRQRPHRTEPWHQHSTVKKLSIIGLSLCIFHPVEHEVLQAQYHAAPTVCSQQRAAVKLHINKNEGVVVRLGVCDAW